MLTIDAREVLHAPGRYEDRYGKYLSLFEQVAKHPADSEVTVRNPPWSWVPLLHYLRAETLNPIEKFDHCRLIQRMFPVERAPIRLDRTAVEVLCCFRPETVDALWKCDMQWKTKRPRSEYKNEFIVTNNGSYHRREILEYMQRLEQYTPPKKNVLLVPCAADKPYPSPMHKAVLGIMPNDYYLCNATGVVGLVPQDLWGIMPHYDSGIPNEWRLFNVARDYFVRNPHDKIVVYCDYYSIAIKRALESINQLDRAVFVNPVVFYYDYIDLLNPTRFNALKKVLNAK